jgi:DNA-binding GntR family transcriptional regulator
LREQALALLREALITGRITDGVVYSAKALAAELGVSDGRLIASAGEHRPVLTAIMRHDERTAERLMRRHLKRIPQDWSRPAE